MPRFQQLSNAIIAFVISFTIADENSGQISFLDTLVSRKNGIISIDACRKRTHTDRCLDLNSQHDRKHQVSAAPNTIRGKDEEIDRVHTALEFNGYPPKFIYDVQTRRSQSSTEDIP